MPAPSLGPNPTILASWFCPFAQRTLIAANFKHVGDRLADAAPNTPLPPLTADAFPSLHQPALQYTLHEVTHDELYSKPSWFTSLNPAGLIPVIAFIQSASDAAQPIPRPTSASDPGTVSIKESLVCNEYLEDAYPQPALLPADPVHKAAARLIIQRFSDKAVPAFYRMLVQQDKAVQAAAATALDTELQWLVEAMHLQGPLALGPELSLVDCAVAPFLLRLMVLEHYRGYTSYKGLKGGAVGERLALYLSAAEAHLAVAATMYHPQGLDYKEQLLQSYARYADGLANSMMARDAKKE